MVVTRVGGLPELVSDSRVICEPDNIRQLSEKITAIFLDRRLYEKLVLDSKFLKSKYSWTAAVDRTITIYQKMLVDKSS